MSEIKNFAASLDLFQIRNKAILSKERVVSVDALWGFDMFWIMGVRILEKRSMNQLQV